MQTYHTLGSRFLLMADLGPIADFLVLDAKMNNADIRPTTQTQTTRRQSRSSQIKRTKWQGATYWTSESGGFSGLRPKQADKTD